MAPPRPPRIFSKVPKDDVGGLVATWLLENPPPQSITIELDGTDPYTYTVTIVF